MPSRFWQFCQGTSGLPRAEEVRSLEWLGRHNRGEPQPTPTAKPMCHFLGPEAGFRQCQTCAGNVRAKEFGCSHPGHAANPVTILTECGGCRDYQAPDQAQS